MKAEDGHDSRGKRGGSGHGRAGESTSAGGTHRLHCDHLGIEAELDLVSAQLFISGVDGEEKNIFYKRLDDASRPGYAEVAWNGERAFGPGEVVSFMSHELHSVVNETDQVTVSLHIYGRHLNYTGRSQFDIDNNVETPFIIK